LEIPPRQTVLNGDHRRIVVKERWKCGDDPTDLMRFERENHNVDGADRIEIVGYGGMRREIATFAMDPYAVRLHRAHMFAPRHERDVRTGVRQRGADVRADRTGSDDRDLHALASSKQTSSFRATRI
jgi:hypothetical protein